MIAGCYKNIFIAKYQYFERYFEGTLLKFKLDTLFPQHDFQEYMFS